MGVILQSVYRRQANPTISVPAPPDGDGDSWWYDHLATHMHEYAKAGFSHIQLPPVHMTIGGSTPSSDGYGVYNEYDLGSEKRPTRFGSAERLQRLCAIMYANGLKPMVDWVPHQRYGGNNGVYNYKSVTGSPGRFAKTPGCFLGAGPYKNGLNSQGRVPRDPIAGNVADDFAFGDELCPINAVPKDYVMNGLIDAGDWLTRRLNIAGYRNDDTKGQAFEAVRRWSEAKAMAGKFIVGEYAEGNKDTLGWWIDQLRGRCYTYDFEVKYHLRDMCNNGSRWNMQRLRSTGLSSKGAWYATKAVTFIENADSDTNGFGSVIFNKLLGYAYILTAEGWPSVYYRDYAQEKYCYGLKPHIDNLIWIHEHLASGMTWWREADQYQYTVYERQGWPGLLVGLNNDIWGGWKKTTVQTSFGANASLHDYTGHCDDIMTDSQGRVTFWIPPNDNGKGYCCYSRQGQGGPLPQHSWATTQEFEGADDLDIVPAIVNEINDVARIWVQAGKTVTLHVTHPTMDGVMFPVIAQGVNNATSPNEEPWKFMPTETGWLDLKIDCQGAKSYPPRTAIPFTLSVTYTAPQTLT